MSDLRFDKMIELAQCPRCGGRDLDRGEREGIAIVGCSNCYWPEPTVSQQLGKINDSLRAIATTMGLWTIAGLAVLIGSC